MVFLVTDNGPSGHDDGDAGEGGELMCNGCEAATANAAAANAIQTINSKKLYVSMPLAYTTPVRIRTVLKTCLFCLQKQVNA